MNPRGRKRAVAERGERNAILTRAKKKEGEGRERCIDRNSFNSRIQMGICLPQTVSLLGTYELSRCEAGGLISEFPLSQPVPPWAREAIHSFAKCLSLHKKKPVSIHQQSTAFRMQFMNLCGRSTAQSRLRFSFIHKCVSMFSLTQMWAPPYTSVSLYSALPRCEFSEAIWIAKLL